MLLVVINIKRETERLLAGDKEGVASVTEIHGD